MNPRSSLAVPLNVVAPRHRIEEKYRKDNESGGGAGLISSAFVIKHQRQNAVICK